MIKKFPKHIVEPFVLAETDQYVIKLAENEEEIEKALRLRYEVFNLEQGKGLQKSKELGIDVDEFDEYCIHLLVMEKEQERVIGTYRVHLGTIACSAKGFYSAREFKIKGLEELAPYCMELGRSCVSNKFRRGAAVALLWGGIAELLARANLDLMLGCVSLEETDPVIGWTLYKHLKETGRISDKLDAKPHEEFKLEYPKEEEMQKLLSQKNLLKGYIPPLFKGYLRLGTNICGEPALDHEFGTIDFLILVDKREVPERYVRHFNIFPEHE